MEGTPCDVTRPNVYITAIVAIKDDPTQERLHLLQVRGVTVEEQGA
jgi:hypothetical protein